VAPNSHAATTSRSSPNARLATVATAMSDAARARRPADGAGGHDADSFGSGVGG